nr:glycosyltransferase [Brevibacterium daeguense]
MLTAYKAYKTFLNVNSVIDSPSMCARRVFEITASGTPVVTAPSAGTAGFFPPDEVFQPHTREEARDLLRGIVRSPELRDRTVHKAQRRIWREHTYTHRAMTVMDAAGIDHPTPFSKSISVLVSTNRPHQVQDVLESVAKQSHENTELVLLTHGFELSPAELRAQAEGWGIRSLVLLSADSSVLLGECLNRAVRAAGGDILTKMDDDDMYGAHYLTDQAAALRYSGAEMVGKQAHYLHLRGREMVMLRFPEREHKFTDLVMGPTMMAPRDVFYDLGFADVQRGEDTDLQRRLVRSGGAIYSADRFNFVQVRGDHEHTWQVDDAVLIANSDVHTFGFAPDHYFF